MHFFQSKISEIFQIKFVTISNILTGFFFNFILKSMIIFFKSGKIMRLFFAFCGLVLFLNIQTLLGFEKIQHFFQASKTQPYHLSVGAVLFDEKGRIACHHFKEVFGHKDIYILMRESMEDEETIFMTLHRGLKEEFGATGKPIAFLGSLSGFLDYSNLPFDKTTV